MPRKNLRESWSRRSASDDSSSPVSIVMYGMPGKKFSVMCVAHVWIVTKEQFVHSAICVSFVPLVCRFIS